MPKFLEDKLKKKYGEASDVPYKIMNSLGYMHGNKTTPKGERAQRKHEYDMKHKKRSLQASAVEKS